ncbi:MAG: ExbD/TolR family protein [Pirellulales bacterium]
MPIAAPPRLDDEAEGPAIVPRRNRQDIEMDMTPMIDCTFLLLIFFTVGAKLESGAELQLPAARYGTGMNPDKAVIVTIIKADDDKVKIYLGDGAVGTPLSSEPADQTLAIREAFERVPGKDSLLIKADRGVRVGDLRAVARAAAEVEGITVLYDAVMESSE